MQEKGRIRPDILAHYVVLRVLQRPDRPVSANALTFCEFVHALNVLMCVSSIFDWACPCASSMCAFVCLSVRACVCVCAQCPRTPPQLFPRLSSNIEQQHPAPRGVW